MKIYSYVSSWVFSLAFRPLVYFKLILVFRVRWGSSFILSHVNIQLLERLFFLDCSRMFLALMSKISWLNSGLDSRLSARSHWSAVLVCPEVGTTVPPLRLLRGEFWNCQVRVPRLCPSSCFLTIWVPCYFMWLLTSASRFLQRTQMRFP